jgi:diadenosine tetraphosphate (Ap4A) HIT family hydrolase
VAAMTPNKTGQFVRPTPATDSGFYYLPNARSDEQRDDMRRHEQAGVCLFCPPYLETVQRVVHRGPLWTVTTNKFPYTNTRLHLLLVPDEHVTDMTGLTEESRREFWAVLQWVVSHYALSYYGLAVRNGDCAYTGATIAHLHVHLLQGDPDAPDRPGVRVRLSSRPEPDRPEPDHPEPDPDPDLPAGGAEAVSFPQVDENSLHPGSA